MHKDLTLIPDDRPGVLARLGEACGDADISIEGLSAFTGQGKGVIHVLVPDAERALAVLTEAGLDVRAARDVIVVDMPDVPGSMGRLCRTVADAGINIEQAYVASAGRLVLIVDQVEAARALLGV
ncbi:MAG TPA: ACT domain-containing protein [Euzebya sp.]|nr:ACT domain-containing protein [Euzebya sp.]